MAKLIVIEGGGEPEPEHDDTIIELIFQALPANSMTQIVTRINAMSNKRRYHLSQVAREITYLRRHADEYQWTIPHAKRGCGVIKGKYFAAVRNTDGTWHADPGSLELLHEGNRGTLSEIAAKALNNAVAIEMYSSQVSSPAVGKLLRRLARDQRHIGEQAKDLSEELANGV